MKRIKTNKLKYELSSNTILLFKAINELVMIVNRQQDEIDMLKFKFSGIKEGYSIIYKIRSVDRENFKKLEILTERGIDIYKKTLREVGQMIGIKHPQSVKNLLIKYKLQRKV